MNDPQQAAVSSVALLTVILAGPGSGKTYTLIERVAHLVARGVAPREIVLLTYTLAAASEMERRLTEALDGAKLGYCGTLHSFCLRILRETCGPLTVLDADQETELLAQSAAAVEYKGTAEDLQKAVERITMRSDQPGRSLTMAEVTALHFRDALRSGGMVTFAMILADALHVLRRAKWKTSYAHLLVDEYQDASDIDAAIYAALPIANKCFVGDPDQAIYGFRGGAVGNLIALSAKPQAAVFRLQMNYRCAPVICRHAQRLIEHNILRVDKATLSPVLRGGEVYCIRHEDEERELSWLACELRKIRAKSAAVIVRTQHLVRTFSQRLIAEGIAVSERKPFNAPADWPATKRFLSFLADPENDWLAYRVLCDKMPSNQAAKIKLQAEAAMQSINAAYFKHAAPQLIDLPELTARNGASRESAAVVREVVAAAPENATLSDIVLAISEAERANNDTNDGITLTTYHGAKGREWDVVFLPAFEAGIIPCAKADIEEERRLAYVGMTRARQTVWLSHAKTRQPQWRPVAEPTIISQFAAEAGIMDTTTTVISQVRAGLVKFPVLCGPSTMDADEQARPRGCCARKAHRA
jgi:DNA helicase-2/ATP-dependent DNA helicase PcrA